MGVNFHFSLEVGFEVSEDQFEKTFLYSEEKEGSFHMEKRFDPKTGKEVAPVKVWDVVPKTESYVQIQGVRYDCDLYELVQSNVLGDLLQCCVDSRHDGNTMYIFSPLPFFSNRNKPYEDYGRVSLYEVEVTVDKVISMKDSLEALRLKLIDLGLDPGPAKVFISRSVG